MTIEQKVREFLSSPGGELMPPPDGVTAEMIRAGMKQMPNLVIPAAIYETRDLHIPTTSGGVGARLYRPSATPDLPLVVYFHGGGFVLCDLDTHDPLCRSLAEATGCVVVSVAYRLAPETKFPGPLHDCYDALCYLAGAARALSINPLRIAVAGDSSGGTLAAATALLVRERGGPALRYQSLIYPVLDPHCTSASMHALQRGYFLTRDMMQWFWAQYLPSTADADNSLAAPLCAPDLHGLPPATIVTGEYDPPRDEAEAYAARLREAGVPVVGRRYLGMIHGFVSQPQLTDVAGRALADVANDLKAALFA
ncbi:MAG: alpha/beta hydrolase [Pseudomonadota bacterium]